MTEAGKPEGGERVGGALFAGVLFVAGYSLVGAILKLYLARKAIGPGSADPTLQDVIQLALAGKFVQDLLQGPIAWIVGSALLWCGLAIFDQKRSFRRVLAATGIPFVAPTVALGALYLALTRHPRPADVVSLEVLIAWVAVIGLLAGLAWTVVRLRALDVEVDRGGASVAFAAALFAFGKWLPTLLA